MRPSGLISIRTIPTTWVVVMMVVFTGCAKSEDRDRSKQSNGPAPMAKSERVRGTAACNDYQRRICVCSAKVPSNRKLATDCELSSSYNDALDLSARIAETTNSSASDRSAALSNARQIIRNCMRKVAELSKGCPKEPGKAEPGKAEPGKAEPGSP